MELDLTTNANVVFLYPQSQVGNTASSPRSSTSASTSQMDSMLTGRRRSSLISRSSSGEMSPSSLGSQFDSLSDEHLEGSKSSTSPTAVLLVTVHLTIPPKVSPPKAIQSLVITLSSLESISFPKGRYEQNQPLNKRIVVEQAAGRALNSGGIYRWEIAVPVPQTTPPYERNRYGSVRQRVDAKMTFTGLLSRSLSVFKPLAFAAVPTKDSTEALTWSRTHAASTGHLGPFFISLRTQHLTVGGFLRAALVLGAPRPDISLVSFTVKLIQLVRVKSRADPKIEESALPSEVELLKATSKELQVNDEKPAENSWLIRLPNCNRIRPSTISGSDVAVDITNNIEVHLSFFDKPFPFERVNPNELDPSGRRLYHYRVSWFIILPSCTLRWRSFRLPAYSMLDSDPVPANLREFCDDESCTTRKFCTCGEDLESLLSYECEAESNLLTSTLMQEDIKRFRQLVSRRIPTEQPISGGRSFGHESLEGRVSEETRGKENSRTKGEGSE